MANDAVSLEGSRPGRRTAFLGVACLLFLAACSQPVSGQDSSALSAAMDQLRNIPQALESLPHAFEAFFPVDRSDLPSGPGFVVPDRDADPLPAPQPVVSAKTPPYASEAIFDLRQAMRREFAKAAGSGEGSITAPQLRTMSRDGKLPFSEDADSYFERHDRDGDGRLSIGEFTPAPSEIAAKCDLEAVTQSFLAGTPYSAGLSPTGEGPGQKGRRYRGGRTP